MRTGNAEKQDKAKVKKKKKNSSDDRIFQICPDLHRVGKGGEYGVGYITKECRKPECN